MPSSFPVAADQVVGFFASLTDLEREAYLAHWSRIAPNDYLETFERWLFAFCSVHTTWTSNVKGFQAIRSWLRWYQDADELKRQLKKSGVGLHENRTKFIGAFCADYWNSPATFYRSGAEAWVNYRDRLVDRILGLGLAKVSFALELIYPCQAEVACFDTHMFQFYGLDQRKHRKYYHQLERHWVDLCNWHRIPSAVARAIYWDRKQGKKDSGYWTHYLTET